MTIGGLHGIVLAQQQRITLEGERMCAQIRRRCQPIKLGQRGFCRVPDSGSSFTGTGLTEAFAVRNARHAR